MEEMQGMDKKRLLELLSYAEVCFERCTNPFARIHLLKEDISADECRDLSNQIASIINEWINYLYSPEEQKGAKSKAEEDFLDTQQ